MSYDAEKSRLLIRQTDSAGPHATLAEIERANQLQAADDRITILEREKKEMNDAILESCARISKIQSGYQEVTKLFEEKSP